MYILGDINKFNDLKPQNKNTKNKKKTKMCGRVLELHNEFLDKYFDKYYDLERETKEKLGYNFIPINLKIKGYDYGKLYNETSDEDYDDYDDFEEEEEYINLSDM